MFLISMPLKRYSRQQVNSATIMEKDRESNGRYEVTGVEVAAKPADIFVVDQTRPFRRLTKGGARLLIVAIPRIEFEKLCSRTMLHGAWLRAHLPVTTVLSAYLTTLGRRSGKLTGNESAAARQSLLTLIAGALTERAGADGSRLFVSHITLRDRILHYVDAHLSEQDLGPEQVMRCFRISRSGSASACCRRPFVHDVFDMRKRLRAQRDESPLNGQGLSNPPSRHSVSSTTDCEPRETQL